MEPKTLSTRTDKVCVHWVSFLDGLQRVLLFTQDDRIAARVKKVQYRISLEDIHILLTFCYTEVLSLCNHFVLYNIDKAFLLAV